jgi:uncharacterized membrane protein YebE (DUF533 family)
VDIERLIGSVIRGTLSGKRKKHGRAMRYLGRGGALGPGTLLALAGVAWGIYETMTKKEEVIAATSAPPPLPGQPASAPPAGGVPSGAQRIVALAMSAARADGTLSDAERTAILEQAKAAGAEAVVRDELASPHPLKEIVEGVTDPEQRAALYRLAFAIVRADEGVSGAERIYLAQLAYHLGLDPAAAAEIEREIASAIDDSDTVPKDL